MLQREQTSSASAPITVGGAAWFKVGWIVLVVAAALMTLNHAVLIVALAEPTLFVGFTAFNLYALVVLLIPFRRRERWSWWATWILPAGLAAPAFADPNLALFYTAAAAACVAGLLLSLRTFVATDR